jgi:M6 family metalloprotease-like protein
MKRACLFLVAVILVAGYMFCQTALSMPPHPDRVAESEAMKAFGEDAVDFEALTEEWREKGINTPSDFNLAPFLATSDTFNILTILIDFPDKASQTAEEFFDTLVYEDRVGTVKNYYLENSYGVFNFTTVTLPSGIGWVTSPENAGYYTSGGNYGLGTYPNNAQGLVEDAVDLADPLVDFSQFDNDSDGWVDGLIVVHAGRGAEYTMNANDIWSHKWGIPTRSKDGKNISLYSMMPEYWVTSGDMTCGVYVHELGHVLGLPDLYDTDNSSSAAGRWSVMASGSWNGVNGSSPSHFDAWSRIQLGFASSTNVASTMMGVSIPAVEDSATIFRLWTSGTVGDEYFLVENRQQTGYDASLPSEGLLIWHIDDAVATDNDNEWYPPSHMGSGHYMVALEQADSLWQLEKKQSYGDGGDPFPGGYVNRNFTPLTTPNSDDYAGDNTLVAITNISDAAAVMSADFTVSFASPAGDEYDNILPLEFDLAQNSPNPFNAETQISFTLSISSDVQLEVFNIIGQKVETLISDHYDAGTYTVNWDGNDSNDSPVASGMYFYTITTDESSSSKKMLLLK